MWSGTFCGISSDGPRHVGLLQRGTPAFEEFLLAGAVDALFDIAHRFQIFVELLAVVGGDLRLQVVGLLKHRVQNAAVELAAFAVAHQLVEGARGIDFLGGRFGGGGPRNGGAVEHGEAVFQAKLVGLDAEREAGHHGLMAELLGHDLIHGGADANVVGVEAHLDAGEHVHAAQVGAGGDERGLVVETADEDQVLADGRERLGGGTEFHGRAGAFRPVVGGIDSVGKVDAGEAQWRLCWDRRPARRRILRQEGQRFQPRQSERDAGAAQEVTA